MNAEMRNTHAIEETTLIITPGTMIIDIISQYRQTEVIFKHLEEETRACVCCEGLFLSLQEAAKRFGFDLETVLADLTAAIDDSVR